MAKKRRTQSDVLWIFDRDEGRSAIPEQVRIERRSEGAFCHLRDSAVDCLAIPGMSIPRHPQTIQRLTANEYRTPLLEIPIEVGGETVGKRQLQWSAVLDLMGLEHEKPALAISNEVVADPNRSHI